MMHAWALGAMQWEAQGGSFARLQGPRSLFQG